MSNQWFPEMINQGPGRPIDKEADDSYRRDVISKDSLGISNVRLTRDVNPDSVKTAGSAPYQMDYSEKEKYLAHKPETEFDQECNIEDISRRKIKLGIYSNHSYRTVTKHVHDESAGTKYASENIYSEVGGIYEGDEVP